ncbi:MAG: hypothetical protein JHD07_06500 [Bradyrhizobium sp.]|uniref:hypothetical protein n=1 Tax=Bradyrhizobium sp. TaxID=376 RepID=UPI001A1DA556|nr:hypothetical protein [Bradyrhizobium sp.]MBJ7402957.1 hypothetical protein [Bradyrhizobium sp.]
MILTIEEAGAQAGKRAAEPNKAREQAGVEGFTFKPAGSDVVQVWQTVNGEHVRIDESTARTEPKVKN